MRFFYSSGAMGYAGEGYFWHKLFNFPDLPLVTKTITRYEKKGNPLAVLPIGDSVYNKVALHNCGMFGWLMDYHFKFSKNTKNVLSLAGSDEDIQIILDTLIDVKYIDSIELNFSCPNVADHNNIVIPNTKKNLYLKLNHLQEPFDYDLDRVKGIRVNSIPMKYGGGSGKVAQEKNWEFIERYNKEGLNVAGSSFTSFNDIKRLEDMGCKEVGIGSIIITNPRLVEKINDYDDWAIHKGLRSR